MGGGMTSVPFWREQGAGKAVVCLHSNASNSAQRRRQQRQWKAREQAMDAAVDALPAAC